MKIQFLSLVFGLTVAGPLVAQTTNTFPTSGSAGIGTTSPAQLLHIKGGNAWAVFERGSTSNVAIATFANSGNSPAWALGLLDSSNTLSIFNYTNSTTALSVLANGNVGIGTVAPEAVLHVARAAIDGTAGPVGDSYAIAQFKVTGSGGGKRGLEVGAPPGSIPGPVYLKVHGTSSRFAVLNESSSEQLTILNSGNVGIGTTNPTQKLEVAGNILAKFNSGPNDPVFKHIDASGNFVFSLNRSDGAGGNGNDFVLKSLNRLFFSTNNTDAAKMVVDNAGNVGIGTASPSRLLELSGPDQIAALSFVNTGNGGKQWRIGTSGSDIRVTETGVADRLTFQAGGNVGIGTTSPSHKLAVNGTIRAKEVIVDNTGWADYVFADDYRLAPLSEVESHIKSERHLPGIPSAREVAANGVSMGEMQAKLLAKIEELTLHVIAQEKRLNAQSGLLERFERLEQENAELRRGR